MFIELIGLIINFVTLITIFVTLVIIYVTTNNISYTFFTKDMIDKDITIYNKQDMLRIVTKSVTMDTK